jgi:hypothetical protein
MKKPAASLAAVAVGGAVLFVIRAGVGGWPPLPMGPTEVDPKV